ncbi:cytochrome P450 [Marasmius fiardii PR-910]|nr:cytochrome P450 [Marasmius fiardii PR-910]
MVCCPEAQQNAQEEIDSVVGKDRLPSLENKNMLLYVMAVFFEVMRWQPVNPLALTHLITEEDEYKGFRIPKTLLSSGTSCIQRSKAPWFKKRRICPGRHFATMNMFAAIASILHSSNITKTKDEVQPALEFEGALQNRPVPFKCEIKLRSEHRERLVRSAKAMIDGVEG